MCSNGKAVPNKPKDEWPDFLDKTILNIIQEKLKFTKMTPVQVRK